MRLEKWFINNLDDFQRKVIVESIDKNIIVKGVAGSGKTNLAIHRAAKAKSSGGSYAILILTVALKRMVAYGMKELGLDNERIAYDWAWRNRGFDLNGEVFCKQHKEFVNGIERIVIEEKDKETLYLVNNNKIRKFKLAFKEYQPAYSKCAGFYGIDFADWVADAYYRAWARRYSWFEEVEPDKNFSTSNPDYGLIPSGTLYKPCENIIDYIIVDEAQDFNVSVYKNSLIQQVGKSLTLLGDSNQKLISSGSAIEVIEKELADFKPFELYYNYRLPKSIAKVAQRIVANEKNDLMTTNRKDGGDSDYPNYPKPIIKKCRSKEDELRWIINIIKSEDMDDVAILVPNEEDIKYVLDFFAQNGITQTQVHYRTSKTVPFRTINTLDFSNNDLPCILNYYAAKGSEFDNVFVPFAENGKVDSVNAFYVACTRASRSLYISYSGILTSYLNNVDNNDVEKI